MSGRAAFGRYLPGESAVHRLDPRTKILLTLVFIAAVLVARNPAGLALCAVAVVGFYAAARITLPQALRSVAPLLVLVVMTALLNLLFLQGGAVYVSWGPLRISELGATSAAFLSCRLTLLLLGASLLVLTTSNLDITDGFERLLSPLSRFGVPAHELAMMMGLALRFLPQFAQELSTIRRAQVSRGASFSGGLFKGGASKLTALLVPLFSSAARHAETLAAAMDARCYRVHDRRTRLHPLSFSRADAVSAALVALLLAAVVLSALVL